MLDEKISEFLAEQSLADLQALLQRPEADVAQALKDFFPDDAEASRPDALPDSPEAAEGAETYSQTLAAAGSLWQALHPDQQTRLLQATRAAFPQASMDLQTLRQDVDNLLG